MPNFAVKRPGGRYVSKRSAARSKRGLSVVSAPRAVMRVTSGKLPQGERPIDGLKTVASQLQQSLAHLNRVKTPAVKTISRAVGMVNAPHVKSGPAPAPRMQRRKVDAPKLRVAQSSKKAAPALEFGADKEARLQLTGGLKKGDPRGVPAAARLAKIVKADALAKTGAIKRNAQIAGMAAAVKKGQLRQVADMDPVQVQRVLEGAVGGRENARAKLASPFIQRLMNQHTNTLNVIKQRQSRTERVSREKTTERTREVNRPMPRTTAAQQRAGAAAKAVQGVPPATIRRAGNRAVDRAFRPQGSSERAVEQSLLNMMGTNEEPHLRKHENTLAGTKTGSVVPYKNSDRVLGGDRLTINESSSRTTVAPTSTLAVNSRAIMPFGSSAAPAGVAKEVMEQVQANMGTKAGRPGGGHMQLTGALKIMGANGQPLGEAVLTEGSIR